MYNTANFHIRQHMTGLGKAENCRQSNEDSSLLYIRRGIDKANHHYEECGKDKRFPYPTKEQWFMGYHLLEAVLKQQDNKDYRALPAQVSQKAVSQCCTACTSFFQARREYQQHPECFNGHPKPPGYRKGSVMTAVFTNQSCHLVTDRRRNTFLKFPGTSARLPLGRFPPGKAGVLKEVKAVPVHGVIELHITMEQETDIPAPSSQPERCIAIDLGVENIAAIANNIGKPPILVKGNVIKSRNWWFNKQNAGYASRGMKRQGGSLDYRLPRSLTALYLWRRRFFRDYFHKITARLIRYCRENRIDTIVIGKNDGWKQKAGLGRVNNQKFVSVPYEMLIGQIRYQAEQNGISLLMQEESYTSRASFIDGDEMPVYGKEIGKKNFSGHRAFRGLYITKEGHRIHADINAAYNILRKALPELSRRSNRRFILALAAPVSWNYQDWYLPKKKAA